MNAMLQSENTEFEDQEEWADPARHEELDPLLDEAERLLEFDRVRDMLAEQARFFISREIILDSHPLKNAADVDRLQEETSEAVLLLNKQGDIGLAGLKDARNPLRRAMLDGLLNGQELLLLRAIFESVRVARTVVERMGDATPHLGQMAEDIRDLRDVCDSIVESLTETGDVLDSATPRLGKLRAASRRAYQRAMRIMVSMASNTELKPFLQSSAIASRSERLVLEVKSSQRQFVPGIIHDVSGTGQTIFVEPFRVVDAANQWRESATQASREEERVLRKLTREVAIRGEDAMISLQAAGTLDAAVARGRLSLKMGGVRPNVQGIDPSSEARQRISLIEARHPLLGDQAVPITIGIETARRGIVITGPNTGGKTVALKTVGLLSLMHQSGMHIPAREGSQLPVFDGVYADIGDAQSIDRSISTFSSHMERVIKIINHTTDESLVLLDELGTGTDPEEGSALARSILDYLVRRGSWVCITTHHRQVSEFAAMHDSLQNASVELDRDTMLPNYRLIMGIPGRSYAMNVAGRLGMPSSVLEHASGMLDPLRSQAEGLLKHLQRERKTLLEAQERAATQQADAEKMRRAAEAELENAERERETIVESAREQIRQEAQRVRRQLRRLMREAEGKQSWEENREKATDIVREVRDQSWMRNIHRQHNAPVSTPSLVRAAGESNDFKVGDKVKVESLGLVGEIADVSDDGAATVMAGAMQFMARPHMMTLIRRAGEKSDEAGSALPVMQVEVSPTYEPAGDLDVRGSRVHMIESVVPQFIDRAFMQGLTSIRIIHGEGSGALREAVRDILSRDSHVETFQPAAMGEGGNGVTVALLG